MLQRAQYWIRSASSLPDDPLTQLAGLAYLSDYFLVSTALLKHPVAMQNKDVMLASLASRPICELLASPALRNIISVGWNAITAGSVPTGLFSAIRNLHPEPASPPPRAEPWFLPPPGAAP